MRYQIIQVLKNLNGGVVSDKQNKKIDKYMSREFFSRLIDRLIKEICQNKDGFDVMKYMDNVSQIRDWAQKFYTLKTEWASKYIKIVTNTLQDKKKITAQILINMSQIHKQREQKQQFLSYFNTLLFEKNKNVLIGILNVVLKNIHVYWDKISKSLFIHIHNVLSSPIKENGKRVYYSMQRRFYISLYINGY